MALIVTQVRKLINNDECKMHYDLDISHFIILFWYLSIVKMHENMFLFLISLYSLGLGIKLTNSLAYSIINGLVFTTCWTLDKREEFIDEKYWLLTEMTLTIKTLTGCLMQLSCPINIIFNKNSSNCLLTNFLYLQWPTRNPQWRSDLFCDVWTDTNLICICQTLFFMV